MAFLQSFWTTLCELSPWLLLGMGLAGLLHVVLPKQFARKNLRGFWGVVKAVAIGVPLPLCSCGVIPTGLGLKKDGASNGSAVAFLISTPQTGVDSVLVSASFFGWPFALFKVIAAAVMGVLAGWITDRNADDALAEPTEGPAIGLPVIEGSPSETSCSSPETMPTTSPIHFSFWKELVAHAVEMLRSIWVWLLVGIFVSATIDQLNLQSFFESINATGLFPAMLLVLLISIPLYVCATASVPVASALVSSGLPPAVALVFLMAGPATNVATIGAIRSRLGNRALAVYLSVIVVGSMLSAWLFDGLIANVAMATGSMHQHDHQSWWAIGSAVIILGLLTLFLWENLSRRFRMGSAASLKSAVQIPVAGMTCGNCVQKLERMLKQGQGVRAVHVDLAQGIAQVGGAVDIDELRSIITAAGFTPGLPPNGVPTDRNPTKGANKT